VAEGEAWGVDSYASRDLGSIGSRTLDRSILTNRIGSYADDRPTKEAFASGGLGPLPFLRRPGSPGGDASGFSLRVLPCEADFSSAASTA
jgi:hypothetical protein